MLRRRCLALQEAELTVLLAPVSPDSSAAPAAIPLTQTSNFQKAISDQVKGANAANLRDSLAQIANVFINPGQGTTWDTSFVNLSPPSAFATKVLNFASQLNATAATRALTVQDVNTAAQSAFSAAPSAVFGSSDYTSLSKGLRDSIFAIKLQQVSSISGFEVSQSRS